LPKTLLTVHLLQKEKGTSDNIKKWKTRLEAKRIFPDRAALAMSTARPSHGTQSGLVISLAGLTAQLNSKTSDKLQILHM
jgi:hypothetical protein